MKTAKILSFAMVLLSAAAIAAGASAQAPQAPQAPQGTKDKAQQPRRFQPPPWPAGIPISGTDRIAEGVYSFRYRDHRTMFVVTSDGVIMTDPLNPRAAPLLMKAIRKVTDQPIEYMIYSHEHGDHASGGQIFKDAGARVIAQEKCVPALNKNPRAVPPDETFKSRRDITLGGTTIELYHFGPGHGQCLAIMRLAKERLAYTVDILTPHSVLFRDIRGDYAGMIATLKKIQEMDVDRIVSGHGIPVAPKSVAGDMLQYLADLEAEVGKAMAVNPSVDAVKKNVNLKKYEKWRSADRFLMQNVEGMMRIIRGGK